VHAAGCSLGTSLSKGRKPQATTCAGALQAAVHAAGSSLGTSLSKGRKPQATTCATVSAGRQKAEHAAGCSLGNSRKQQPKQRPQHVLELCRLLEGGACRKRQPKQ